MTKILAAAPFFGGSAVRCPSRGKYFQLCRPYPPVVEARSRMQWHITPIADGAVAPRSAFGVRQFQCHELVALQGKALRRFLQGSQIVYQHGLYRPRQGHYLGRGLEIPGDQQKPVPPAESSRDSGRPPIQEQQPLESPFVKFR